MRIYASKELVSGLVRKSINLLTFLCICLVATGCGSDAPKATKSDLQALDKRALAPHRFQVGEKLRVTVYSEASLSGDYQIEPSGMITLPLIGPEKALGLTPDELSSNLSKEYSNQYLKEPRITVSILEFRPFYVVGEVEKPGSYPYQSGLSLKNILAIAGGTTFRANTSYVLIQHAGENEVKSYEVGITPIPILPGDLIEVPRRYI